MSVKNASAPVTKTEARPKPLILEVETAGKHSLEILTPEEFAALGPGDFPGEFFRCRDWHVRILPVH